MLLTQRDDTVDMDKKLGELKKVELREVWKREDIDFSKWLAQEENLALLNQTLSLEMEVTEEV